MNPWAGLVMAVAAAAAPDFWGHWSDGKAEMNGYRLVQPRYGAKAPGRAVIIYVTEDFSDSLRVKADPGKHPASDVYPVLKMNAVRDFQTGVYDYNLMTSVFAKVAPGWPLAKVSFSAQDWCGHVYHHLLPKAGRVAGVRHSYFDGEADGHDDLAQPEGGVYEDVLPIVLRGWNGAYLERGQTRSVPFLPSLLRARLEHRGLAWGRARIARAARTSRVTVPAGSFEVDTWTVAQEAGPTTTYQFEAAPPFRLVRWSVETGEEGTLLGSTRMPYWEVHGPGDERRLKELGLEVPASK